MTDALPPPQGERYARLRWRLASSLLDWNLCFAIPFLFAGLLAGALWSPVVAACVLAYFTAGYARGRTAGMAVFGLRLVDRGGGPPGRGRAFLRALLAVVQAAAVLALIGFAFSDRPARGYSPDEIAVAVVAGIVAGASFAAHWWIVVDEAARTWLDRLFGFTVLERGERERPRRR